MIDCTTLLLLLLQQHSLRNHRSVYTSILITKEIISSKNKWDVVMYTCVSSVSSSSKIQWWPHQAALFNNTFFFPIIMLSTRHLWDKEYVESELVFKIFASFALSSRQGPHFADSSVFPETRLIYGNTMCWVKMFPACQTSHKIGMLIFTALLLQELQKLSSYL